MQQSQSLRILGTRVDNVTLSETFDEIESMLKDGKKHHIVTVNPEILLAGRRYETYRNTVNNSDLSLCDGSGIRFAAKYLSMSKKVNKGWLSSTKKLFLGLKVGLVGSFNQKYLSDGGLRETIVGVDLISSLLRYFSNQDLSVYFIGARYQDGQSSDNLVKTFLEQQIPKINYVGSYSGMDELSNNHYEIKKFTDIKSHIEQDATGKIVDIVFVAFGGVKQEMWIKENMNELPGKIFIGVGGAFDLLSGRRKRAPKFMRSLGLEWLYRFFERPNLFRLKRIINASIVFPFLVYKESLKD